MTNGYASLSQLIRDSGTGCQDLPLECFISLSVKCLSVQYKMFLCSRKLPMLAARGQRRMLGQWPAAHLWRSPIPFLFP